MLLYANFVFYLFCDGAVDAPQANMSPSDKKVESLIYPVCLLFGNISYVRTYDLASNCIYLFYTRHTGNRG